MFAELGDLHMLVHFRVPTTFRSAARRKTIDEQIYQEYIPD